MQYSDKAFEELKRENDQLKVRNAGLQRSFDEYKNVSERLQISEERYKGIVQNTINCIAIYKAIDKGQHFIFLDFNPMAEKVEQVSKEEVLGKRVTDVFPGIKKFGLLKVFQDVWRSGNPVHFPISIYKDDRIQGYRENYIYKLSSGEIVAVYKDDTGSKKLEEEVRNSEERLKIIFESAPDAIYLNDFKGKFLDGNKAAEDMLGYSREELIGANFFQLKLLSPKEILKVSALLLKNIQGHGTGPEEFVLNCKDGKQITTEISSYPVKIKGKSVVLGVARDITERKQAESKLQAERDNFYAIFESMTDGIYIVNKDYDIQFVNRALIRDLGPPEGKKCYKYFHNYNEPCSFCKNDDVFAGKTLQWEWTSPRNGQTYDLVDTPFNNPDGSICKLEIFRNITERKEMEIQLLQSEHKFRLLADNTYDWEYWIDPDGKYVYLSDSCKRITGYSASEFTNNPELLFSLVHPDHVDKVQAHYENQEDRNKPMVSMEFPIIHRRGELRWIEHNCTPVFDDNGLYLGRRGNNRDITSRKQAEGDLIAALNKAEESDRLKSAFLSNMSHEIRTPMNGILGFSELLKEPNLSGDEQQEYIKIIEKSGMRMLNTINDLIEMSTLEAGQMNVSISDVNINEQLVDIYNFFKPEVENKGIQFSYNDLLLESGLIVKTDGEKLHGIFINLVKNAIKYTIRGSIEFGCLKRNGFVEFFVKDTGMGIPKDLQQLIFERFTHIELTASKTIEGSGLGLSITKAYVELLGGNIWVESEVGKGSVFYFTIPLKK
ncbi:MAG: PAS domain S-box protein [Bacteroidetes bacterium]|jgi:PAS domain S-box-containing protein|nr:PAS domain S-box protein [Bacteroidota bacterium]MBT3748074.1 PAS domain S-box protein [Bacteroidota bacterium]MBT4400736.1 PAS domain S-box protein [Bacteroidota bacterium]MBT4408462.1 PAS domain S-box protein [Bacteroidota bacterium]MBT7091705.1 PAS domain S-box protein [Bacteroidota bacterium]